MLITCAAVQNQNSRLVLHQLHAVPSIHENKQIKESRLKKTENPSPLNFSCLKKQCEKIITNKNQVVNCKWWKDYINRDCADCTTESRSCVNTLAASLWIHRTWKPGIFQLTYQLHNSSADCAGELFKPSKSKDLASLRVCNENKDFWFWVSFFYEWLWPVVTCRPIELELFKPSMVQKVLFSRICLICHLKGIRKKWRIRRSDELCKQVEILS